MQGNNNITRISNSGGGSVNIKDSGVGTNNIVTNINDRPAINQATSLASKDVPRSVKENLIVIHRRCLEQLYLQEAELGVNCPPHIKIEIEDRESAIEVLKKSIQ